MKINEVTDGASASDSGMASTSTSSTGESPTTTGAQGTSEANTDAVSTGEATSTTGNSSASPSTGELGTDGTTAGTGGGLDMGMEEAWNAKVERACAPDDGPAVEFHFDHNELMCGMPWADLEVRVALFQPWPLAPGSYSIAGGNGSALLNQGNQPEWSEIGTINIDAWEGDTVSGSYSLQFADLVLEGEFTGPFCPDVGGPCG